MIFLVAYSGKKQNLVPSLNIRQQNGVFIYLFLTVVRVLIPSPRNIVFINQHYCNIVIRNQM